MENTNSNIEKGQVTASVGWFSPITDSFLNAFASEKLIIDCPSITLTQQVAKLPKVITGRGMIALQNSDSFQLRMYTDLIEKNPLAELVRKSSLEPGVVIPDDQFFKLEAVDISGVTWRADNIYVDLKGHIHGVVATAKFDLLTHLATALPTFASTDLSMWFFDALDVPFTQFVTTKETAGERELRRTISAKYSSIEVDPYKFEIASTDKEKGTTVLRLISKCSKLPAGIESRILEALRYVTFAPLNWCIVEKKHNGICEVTIAPKRKLSKCIFEEPLTCNRPDYGKDYWALFSKYFSHVIRFEDELKFHPLSAQLSQIISAESRQLHICGLLVSVAVEGVLNCEFDGLGAPSKAFLDSIESAEKIITRLKCLDTSLAARIKGSLNPMKSARAADKLKILLEKKVVTKQMVADWQKLRNTTAHASVHESEKDIQKLLNQCYTVYTLLNLLVFTAIGYSGKYNDFSSRGWPTRDFQPSS